MYPCRSAGHRGCTLLPLWYAIAVVVRYCHCGTKLGLECTSLLALLGLALLGLALLGLALLCLAWLGLALLGLALLGLTLLGLALLGLAQKGPDCSPSNETPVF